MYCTKYYFGNVVVLVVCSSYNCFVMFSSCICVLLRSLRHIDNCQVSILIKQSRWLVLLSLVLLFKTACSVVNIKIKRQFVKTRYIFY